MGTDLNKAFELDDGIILGNGVGVISDSFSPVGVLDSPISTFYIQKLGDGFKIWEKVAAGINGWLEFTAAVAQAVEFEAFADNTQSDTTSDIYLDKLTATTSQKVAGSYLILHSAQVANSQNNKRTGYRVQWKKTADSTWIDLFEIEYFPATGGGIFGVQTGVNIIDLDALSTIDLRSQWGLTIDGGIGSIKNTSFTIIKVEDIV